MNLNKQLRDEAYGWHEKDAKNKGASPHDQANPHRITRP